MNNEFKEISNQLMCPPGHGVFTVNTAKERKDKLNNLLYPNSKDVTTSWQQTLDELPNVQKTNVLGICSDTGGGILRSANWGPLFIRLKLLEELNFKEDFFDLGDIRVIPHLLHDKYLNQETITNCRKALYNNPDSLLPVSPLSITEHVLDTFYDQFPHKTVFALGGDHSVSYPLVKSYLRSRKKLGKKVALIHFDAHTDLLTERLGIDLCFGSWVTHILEDLEKPSHCIQIGIRSSGKPKSHWEKTFGIQQYWNTDVFDLGAEKLSENIKEYLLKEKIDELYISFDIDALDQDYAGSTGTPEPNGLEPHQSLIIMKNLLKDFPLGGADLVEVAPFLRTSPEAVTEPEATLDSALLISKILIDGLNKYAHI